MEKNEIRVVIKYFYLKGLTPSEIKTELDSVLHDSSPSSATIKKWTATFKRGTTSTNDAPRGRPKIAASEEIVAKIKKVVLSDRRMKVRVIAEASSISKSSVAGILHEDLNMRKLSKDSAQTIK